MKKTQLITLLSTASIIALGVTDAQARRSLVPEQPSVEVRLEALRALKRSVQAERAPRYAARPAAPSAQVPFGAPTPPRPVIAQPSYTPPPQQYAAPAPQPVAPRIPPNQSVVVPVAPAPLAPPVQIARPLPVPPAPPKIAPKATLAKVTPPPVKVAEKPARKPAPKAVETVVTKKAPAKIAAATPPKPDFKELPSLDDLPPLEVVEENGTTEFSELSLDDIVKDKPKATIKPPKIEPPKVAALPDVTPPKLDDLPEPDLKDLTFEGFKKPEADISVDDVEKEMAALSLPDFPEPALEIPDVELPTKKLPDIKPPSINIQKPSVPDVAVDTPPALPKLEKPKVKAPEIALPKPDMPELPQALPDIQAPEKLSVPPVLAAPKPPAPSVADKEDGILPSLKQSFRTFLGSEEKKPTPAPKPVETKKTASIAPAPAIAPPAGLPPLPSFETAGGSVSQAPTNDLPPLPSFDDAPSGDVFGRLPDALGLPPLPGMPTATDQAKSTINTIVPDSQPKELASLDDFDGSLPPLDALKSSNNKSEKAALTVNFSQSETEVPLSFQQPLINLSKELIANPNSRIKVVAYASASDDQRSIARRISLARALAVRAFLIDLGVDNVRISVEALGNEIKGGPSERADIIITSSS